MATKVQAPRFEVTPEKIHDYVSRYRDEKGSIIGILQEIQDSCQYVPEEALELLSRELGVPMAELFALVTFYRAFSLKPKGKYKICVCTGTACHVRGATHVLEHFERVLNVRSGETTADLKFTLETVNCVGACAIGPVAVVNSADYHGMLDGSKVEGVVDGYRNREGQE
jgi:NADH-quinone oxidoreductase subunit E